jgi:hypothetical protein
LDAFIRDPEPTLALLEMLKDDASAYVRKSVANHLNDLSKDHPARVLEVAREWYAGGSENTRWIVRHGLRTLIKAGSAEALAILGYRAGSALTATLTVWPECLHLGDSVTLKTEITHTGGKSEEAVIDYRIHFVRANGSSGAKVFKWTTRTLTPGETTVLEKTHPLRLVSTRTYYPGLHRVELQVNGMILANAAFELTR